MCGGAGEALDDTAPLQGGRELPPCRGAVGALVDVDRLDRFWLDWPELALTKPDRSVDTSCGPSGDLPTLDRHFPLPSSRSSTPNEGEHSHSVTPCQITHMSE